MPCLEENQKNIDVALEILDAVTPRINVGGDVNPVVRETTQTDHLNKRLLKTFLDRLNVTSVVPTINNSNENENS